MMKKTSLFILLLVTIISVVAQETGSWFIHFSDNRAVVRVDSLYGFINPQGQRIIPARYTKAYCFNDGIAMVRDGLEVYAIDTMGQRLDHKVRIPQFRGGDPQTFIRWVTSRIPFVGSEEYRSLRGEVVSALFRIGVDGNIVSCENVGEHDGLSFSKLHDVVMSSPKWSSGQVDGRAVSIVSLLPVEFHRLRPVSCYPIDQNGGRMNQDFIYPLFEGKYASEFYGWFFRNLKFKNGGEYQRAAAGPVKVEFTIDKKGRLGDVNIISSHNDVCRAKTLQILEKSPRWTPGTVDGKPVDIRYQMTFRFSFR